MLAVPAIARSQVLTAILETTLEVFEDQQPFCPDPSAGEPWVAGAAEPWAPGRFSSVLNVSLGMPFSSVSLLSGSPSSSSQVSLSPASLPAILALSSPSLPSLSPLSCPSLLSSARSSVAVPLCSVRLIFPCAPKPWPDSQPGARWRALAPRSCTVDALPARGDSRAVSCVGSELFARPGTPLELIHVHTHA